MKECKCIKCGFDATGFVEITTEVSCKVAITSEQAGKMGYIILVDITDNDKEIGCFEFHGTFTMFSNTSNYVVDIIKPQPNVPFTYFRVYKKKEVKR